jgi:hypothetical protein
MLVGANHRAIDMMDFPIQFPRCIARRLQLRQQL